MQSQISTDTAVGESAPFNREEDLIGWRDRGLLALLLLALCLLGWSWARLEGYELADAVEYLERADELLSRGGGMRESESIRSFGFSGLLLPIFFVAEGVEAVTGYQNRVLIAHAARILQIAMTLGLIGVTARIAGALGGRGAGYAAGALLTSSPIVLQWGVTPVSGIAAGLLIALSLEHLVVDDGLYEPRRRGWLAGLGLGGAFMMAYQTILVVVPIFVLIFLRRRARPVVARSLVVLGVALCVLTQMGLDYLYYGAFGKSVLHYFVLNLGTVVPVEIHKAGELLHLEPLKDLARWLYGSARGTLVTAGAEQALLDSTAGVETKLPRNWYLVNLPSALTWPGVLALVAGIGFILYKRARMPLSLLVIAAFNIAAMSEKGSKDFRLFLPFLSILAVLGGLGFRAFAGNSRPRLGIGVALLALAVVLGVREQAETNRTRHGAFWRAMAHVNREAALERAAAPRSREEPVARAACTFHWSVLLRESPDVELDKLPLSIDRWESYTEGERAAAFAQIARLDWFIAHLPALTEHPEVLAFVAREFAVQAAFYDRRDAGDFGPVLVLERRSGDPHELVLYETREGLDPTAWAAARGLSRPLAFGRAGELLLLGVEFDRLPGDGHGWLTYHWYGARLERDVTVVDRITSPGSTHSWHNNHLPAYGMLPTSSWPEGVVAPSWSGAWSGPGAERPGPSGGWILSEGYLVVPEADPYIAEGPERFIGGDYMRADLVPGDLWVDVGTLSPDGEVLERLEAVRPSDGAVVSALAPPLAAPTPDGWSTSHDGMTRVASFLIPITGRQRERARQAGPGG